MNYQKRFCVYDPRNHGIFSNRWNLVNLEYIDFLVKDEKFYVRNSTSSDGIFFECQPWQELTIEQFFVQYENVVIAQYKDIEKGNPTIRNGQCNLF